MESLGMTAEEIDEIEAMVDGDRAAMERVRAEAAEEDALSDSLSFASRAAIIRGRLIDGARRVTSLSLQTQSINSDK
jgi:hypothetical protein